jgi:hypothetical protein
MTKKGKCDECGYHDDACASHYEECSKLEVYLDNDIKKLVNYMYHCAERNCDIWEEPYKNKFEAWELSHESTWLEDYEDMQEECGISEDQIKQAVAIVNEEVSNELY